MCVPLSLVVGRSDRAVVVLEHATAYSTGLTFDVIAAARRLTERETSRLMREHQMSVHPKRVPDEFIRVDFEFADGTRVSNVDALAERPQAPLLVLHGGSGGSITTDRMDMRRAYWLWPLPPPGLLRVSVDWPALDIRGSSVEVPSDVLREAARRSSSFWAADQS